MMKPLARRLTIISLVALILVLSFLIDDCMIDLINSIKNPVMDSFFSFIVSFEEHWIFYPIVALISIFLVALRKKQNIIPYVISIILTLGITFTLKGIIQRPRIDDSARDSFPSGHTTALFTLQPFLTGIISIIWLILSLILVFARMWAGMHYFSDIIAGMIIGYGISYLIIRLYQNFQSKRKVKRLKKKKG